MSGEGENGAERAGYRRFLVRFVFYTLALYVAASLLPYSVYAPINRLTANHTGMLLSAFDMQSVIRGEYLFVGGFSAWIVPECTPIFMILVFSAFLFSFPASVKDRLTGLLFGATFITAANVLRLGLTIAIGSAVQSGFPYIHAHIGPVWSILSVLIACLVWVRWCDGTGKPAGIRRFLVVFTAAASILFIAWMPLNQGYVMIGDALLKFLFSLFGANIVFTYHHDIYYHTLNHVIFVALVLADKSMTRAEKTRGLAIGLTIIVLMHLVFRVLSILFAGYGLAAFLPVATMVHLIGQLLIPIVLWLALGAGLSIRQRLMTIRFAKTHASRFCMVLLIFLSVLALGRPHPACAQARLIDEAGIRRGLNSSQAKTYVIVNLADPGGEDLMQQEGRVSRRRNVREVQERVFMGVNAKRVKLTNRFDYHAGFSAEVTHEGLEELRRQDYVVSIELDRKLQLHTNQGIALMNAADVRNTYNGEGVAIAVVDSGIDYTHPKLSAKYLGGYDFGGSYDNPAAQDADPMDVYGHGTSCAGIAAGATGTTGDYIGGVAYGAKLYAVKVTYGSTGNAYTSDMIAAWEWCIAHKNDNPNYPIMVINTSMGGAGGGFAAACDGYSVAMTTAASNAVAAGITLFVSSGNDGYCNAIAWPACISNVIAVGAVFDASLGVLGFCVDVSSCAPNQGTHTNCSPNPVSWSYSITPNREAPYSNTAPILGLFAPSNKAYTTAKGGTYVSSFGGTSAAAPYAAGAAAILQSTAKAQLSRFLTPAEVRSILVSTGDSVTDVKINYGIKRINLGAAVNAVMAEPVPALDYVGFLMLALAMGVLAVFRLRQLRSKKAG